MPEGPGVLNDKVLKDSKLGRSEIDYSVSRLINTSGVAGGTNLPPRLIAGLRVPIVTGLKLEKVASYFGGTQITVSWLDAQDNFRVINGYNVYVQNLNDENPKPQGPYFTSGSPATVRLVTNQNTVAVLTVQTLLNSGQTSDLNISPSVAVTIPAAASSPDDFDPNTVPIDALEDGTAGQLITWDPANAVTTIGPGAADAILVGSGAGAVPQFKTRATLDLVEGRANITTANRVVKVSASGVVTQSAFLDTDVVTGAPNLTNVTSVPFISAAGVLNEATEATWDDTAKLLTLTQPTLGTPVQRLVSTATNDDPTELVVQARVATTNATLTTLHTFAIPATTTVALEIIIVARRTGGAAGTAEDGARYKLSATYKNVAGTATIIGAVTIVADEDQAAWDAQLNPSGSDVLLQIQGAVDNNVTWHMTSRVYSVGS